MIRVWNLADSRELRRFEPPEPTPQWPSTRLVALAPDGRSLACGGNTDEVAILDINTGRSLAELNARVNNVGALVYAPDGKLLATAGAGDGRPATGRKNRRCASDHNAAGTG